MEREGCYIKFYTGGGKKQELGERIGSQFRNERDYVCQNYAPAGYAFADILPFSGQSKRADQGRMGRRHHFLLLVQLESQ